MEQFVLDTNLFFNMQADLGVGSRTEDIVVDLTKKLKQLKREKCAEALMPPRVIDEFLSFFTDQKQPFLRQFLSVVTVKSPDPQNLTFSADILYRLIDDVRERNYRGLRAGEEEIEQAGKLMTTRGQLLQKEFQITIGVVVKKFRERYRRATRVGFIDSLADLDLIMLAKEQRAFLVSADEGVMSWGRAFGVKEMLPAALMSRLEDLLRQE